MEDEKDQIQGPEAIIIADDLSSDGTVNPEQLKKFYEHRFVRADTIFKTEDGKLEDGKLFVLNFPDSIEDRLIDKLIDRMKEERFAREPETTSQMGEWIEIEARSRKEFAIHVDKIREKMECQIARDDESDGINNVCIGGPNVSVSPFIKEPLPQFIKDMYKLPFDEEVIPRMTAEQREQLYKKPDGYLDETHIKELHKKEMEEFKTTDLQLLRDFFAREWKAVKELWKTWRDR
jgi:hypothetical protein